MTELARPAVRDPDDTAKRRYLESTGRRRFVRFWREFVRRRPLGTAGAVLIVVMRHALRNALLPVVTVISLEFAFLIGGLVVTEQVFNLNGIGKLLVDAVAHRDYTMIQSLVLLLAAVFVLVNFAVDMVYMFLDPRIRYA